MKDRPARPARGGLLAPAKLALVAGPGEKAMAKSGGFGDNACAGIDPVDRTRLEEAAQVFVDAHGLFMEIAEFVGTTIMNVGGSAVGFLRKQFDIDVHAKAEEITEATLWAMQSGATIGLDSEGEREPWDWFNKLVVVASGGSGGFFGAPGLIWDLPITTGVIMRSIAEIARSFPHESITSDDTKRACIEVFAFGGPASDDDDADAGYWATRAGLSHVTIEALIKAVAARFGVVLSEKVLAQSVPIAGALAGAGMNYAFIDYYQQMARVHFTIRDVERRAPDPPAVRPCFSQLVRKVREQRKVKR